MKTSKAEEKNVLISVLDWGLGHATRSIALINKLIDRDLSLILGGSGPSLLLLREAFPILPWREFPAYDFSYPRRAAGMGPALLRQLPRIWKVRKAEMALLASMVQKGEVGGVISDHRYGLHHPSIPSVFLGHQLCPQIPPGYRLLASPFRHFHHTLLQGFSRIWVPDDPGSPLSGILSGGMGSDKRIRFIGPLSRFDGLNAGQGKKFGLGVLLSGPEPQRSMLEDLILAQLTNPPFPVLLVRGLPGERALPAVPQGVEVHNHLPVELLFRKLSQSEKLVCRSGYSSGMDLQHLKVPVFFVPTPGQTEQEYLARHWNHRWGVPFSHQKNFSLKQAMDAPLVGMYGGWQGGGDEFDRAVEEFLCEVRKNPEF